MRMSLQERCATLRQSNVDYMRERVQLLAKSDALKKANEELTLQVAQMAAERSAACERAYYEGVSRETIEAEKDVVVKLCRRLLDHYPRSDTVRKTIIKECEAMFAELERRG